MKRKKGIGMTMKIWTDLMSPCVTHRGSRLIDRDCDYSRSKAPVVEDVYEHGRNTIIT
jgi:hypothetical protein